MIVVIIWRGSMGFRVVLLFCLINDYFNGKGNKNCFLYYCNNFLICVFISE